MGFPVTEGHQDYHYPRIIHFDDIPDLPDHPKEVNMTEMGMIGFVLFQEFQNCTVFEVSSLNSQSRLDNSLQKALKGLS